MPRAPRLARLLLAAGLPALVGCPGPTAPPPGPGGPAPTEAAPPPPPGPGGPAPTEAAPPPPVPAPPTEAPPPPTTEAPPVTPPPPPSPPGGPGAGAAGEEEVLRRGARRRLQGDRAVGLAEVEAAVDGRPARAELDVAAGPCYLKAHLPVGVPVEVGGATVVVVGVDAPRAVRLRVRPGGPAEAPLRAAPAAEGRLRLAGLVLHALPDGVRVGVGNVRVEAGERRVTLTVFPPGYAERPAQGYDLHVDAAEGATLAGEVRRVRVHALAPEEGGAGAVELELLPPR